MPVFRCAEYPAVLHFHHLSQVMLLSPARMEYLAGAIRLVPDLIGIIAPREKKSRLLESGYSGSSRVGGKSISPKLVHKSRGLTWCVCGVE